MVRRRRAAGQLDADADASGPVRARTSKADGVFFVRMNNSTRALPDDEVDAYVEDHWVGP